MSFVSLPRQSCSGLWQFITLEPTKPLLADQVFTLNPKPNPPVIASQGFYCSGFIHLSLTVTCVLLCFIEPMPGESRARCDSNAPGALNQIHTPSL